MTSLTRLRTSNTGATWLGCPKLQATPITGGSAWPPARWRRILQRTYGIVEDGARFYGFGLVDNPAAFRRRYREALDSVPFDDAERGRVVDEAVRAFELNIAVLAQLAGELAA